MDYILQLLLWKYSGFLQQVQPKCTFIRFFENDTELSDELGTRTCTTCRPVVCSDRGSGPQQLLAEDMSFLRSGQRSVELDDSQCEAFRPDLEMFKILHVQTLACDFSLYRDRAHSAIVWFLPLQFDAFRAGVWFYFFNLTSDF